MVHTPYTRLQLSEEIYERRAITIRIVESYRDEPPAFQIPELESEHGVSEITRLSGRWSQQSLRPEERLPSTSPLAASTRWRSRSRLELTTTPIASIRDRPGAV